MDLQALSSPLYSARGWLKFIGVMFIINGVLTALSIFGILIAWVPIWLGILLFQIASAAEQAFLTQSEAEFLKSQTKLKTYFTITGVLMLIGLIFMVLFLGLGGLAVISQLASNPKGF
ncbi:DUF5362 family protein [Umboniibacter marinipuniceus]|uniref:Transmembrane protein n=1 Tax=Umboniibacter marinipuniceus TaxID=569599 RepID=A0A3M0A6C3_9GAMM|nr:DUF5362 family protein [Umboniibacter marinipuniceus]RMA80146.1 hypothetical protein DFR27_1509 [Umboniibacter marinipuniceus]